MFFKDLNEFNESQKTIIIEASAIINKIEPKLCFIQGPPGTGKSTTITGILKVIFAQSKNVSSNLQKPKILLCSPSNCGCDELARKVLSIQKRCFAEKSIVRVRSIENVIEDELETITLDYLAREKLHTNKNIYTVKEKILREADIIISTLNYCGNSIMDCLTLERNCGKNKIDLIIVDEAAQSLEIESLIPLRFGCNKMIQVGDPEQLPATVVSQKALVCSLF